LAGYWNRRTASRTGRAVLRIASIQTGSAAGFLAGALEDVRFTIMSLILPNWALANTAPVLATDLNRTIFGRDDFDHYQ